MPVLIKPDAYRPASPIVAAEGGTKAVTGILTETRFFRFRKPIRVTEHQDNGLWVHDCKTLGIHAYGETRKAAWNAFVEIFECDWDSVAQEKDARLTKGAQELKRKYLDLVESVDPLV